MKARKVTVTLELFTALPIKTLRDKEWWKGGMIDSNSEDENLDVTQVQVNVTQVQVNVIKPSK